MISLTSPSHLLKEHCWVSILVFHLDQHKKKITLHLRNIDYQQLHFAVKHRKADAAFQRPTLAHHFPAEDRAQHHLRQQAVAIQQVVRHFIAV